MVEEIKKKRQYFNQANIGTQRKRRRYGIRNNSKGVLLTVGSPHHTREGFSEFITIIQRELPTLNKPEDGSTDDHDDIAAAVEKELKEIKEENNRFVPFNDITKGVVFCQFTSPNDNPNDMVFNVITRLMETVSGSLLPKEADDRELKNNEENSTALLPIKNKKINSCRFLNRALPIDITCSPHLSHFKRASQLLVAAYFPESDIALYPDRFAEKDEVDSNSNNKTSEINNETTPISTVVTPDVKTFTPSFIVPKGANWSIKFQRRGGMTTLDRDEVISLLGKYVGTQYKVNLSEPDFTIVVEVLPTFCGISVLRKYTQVWQYNLHRIFNPELYVNDKTQ